jgi:hypothetical protein
MDLPLRSGLQHPLRDCGANQGFLQELQHEDRAGRGVQVPYSIMGNDITSGPAETTAIGGFTSMVRPF